MWQQLQGTGGGCFERDYTANICDYFLVLLPFSFQSFLPFFNYIVSLFLHASL